jgi:hypothetical protein
MSFNENFACGGSREAMRQQQFIFHNEDCWQNAEKDDGIPKADCEGPPNFVFVNATFAELWPLPQQTCQMERMTFRSQTLPARISAGVISIWCKKTRRA